MNGISPSLGRRKKDDVLFGKLGHVPNATIEHSADLAKNAWLGTQTEKENTNPGKKYIF
jgi:hypothetical protein